MPPDLYSVRPCRSSADPEPGVRLSRAGELLNRLTPDEARSLGADLILAAVDKRVADLPDGK